LAEDLLKPTNQNVGLLCVLVRYPRERQKIKNNRGHVRRRKASSAQVAAYVTRADKEIRLAWNCRSDGVEPEQKTPGKKHHRFPLRIPTEPGANARYRILLLTNGKESFETAQVAIREGERRMPGASCAAKRWHGRGSAMESWTRAHQYSACEHRDASEQSRRKKHVGNRMRVLHSPFVVATGPTARPK
jgi:hypothetical protein